MQTVDAKHVIGNHCLSVPRELLLKRLGIASTGYYRSDVAPGWRLIVLDTSEMSPHSGYQAVRDPSTRDHVLVDVEVRKRSTGVTVQTGQVGSKKSV